MKFDAISVMIESVIHVFMIYVERKKVYLIRFSHQLLQVKDWGKGFSFMW